MRLSAENARSAEVRRGLRLEYINIAYNALEAVVALVCGAIASSIALIGFGVDSLIETSSNFVMLWRLHSDEHHRREDIERLSQRLIGLSFWALAIYIAYESAESLWSREAPARSIPGIILAVMSMLIMPLLARAKRRVAHNISSAAMIADSRQTDLCAWLSVILLAGLGLNAAMGWWWADPAAGLVMVPIIAKEGYSAWRGDACPCPP